MSSLLKPRFALCCLMVVIGSGCTTGNQTARDAGSAAMKVYAVPEGLHAEAQYRSSFDSTPAYQAMRFATVVTKTGELIKPSREGSRYCVLEVFLTNRRRSPVEWDAVALDAKEIRAFPASPLLWFQFYPTRTAKPRETTLLQLCFEKNPNAPRDLEIRTKDGETVRAKIEPFSATEAQIVGITFGADFRHANIFFTSNPHKGTIDRALPPRRIVMNGENMRSAFRVLALPTERTPGMITVILRKQILPGQLVHAKLEFADGQNAQCILRASTGIMLDAFGVDEANEALRHELALDQRPATKLIPSDPACEDTAPGRQYGFSLSTILPTRESLYESNRICLTAVHMCVLATPQVSYAIYGQCADALEVNPYRLRFSHSDDGKRFIEEEENFFRWGWLASRPRPWYWIPEAFTKSKNTRILEPQELRLLAYAALGHGAKGFNYYTYGSGADWLGFNESAELVGEIKKINREVKRLGPFLSESFPTSIETIGGYEHGFRVYTLWSGDDGMLLILRNLDYMTDREANELGKRPRFKVVPKQNISVKVRRPGWFALNTAIDVLEIPERRLPCRVGIDGLIEIEIDSLELIRVLWLQNAGH